MFLECLKSMRKLSTSQRIEIQLMRFTRNFLLETNMLQWTLSLSASKLILISTIWCLERFYICQSNENFKTKKLTRQLFFVGGKKPNFCKRSSKYRIFSQRIGYFEWHSEDTAPYIVQNFFQKVLKWKIYLMVNVWQ